MDETAKGPLVGTVVLDLGQAAVAPVAASYLGMLGARVIKVEPPRGDMVRVGQPDMRGTSTTFIGNNWTKFGVCLDLKEESGRRRLTELIIRADLLIENFRNPQVLERLGFDFETMTGLNPRLVYVESSAFGDGGPFGDMVSNEWITEAIGGLVGVTGQPGQPEFMRGTSLLDWSGAMVNTVVCLAALLQRDITGRGLAVRTSQLGSTVFAGLTRVVEMFATGRRPGPLGSDGSCFAPDGAFTTSDGHLGLTALTDRCWQELCAAVGATDLQDRPDLADNASRVRHRDAIRAALDAALVEHPTSHWLRLLADHDIPHHAFPTDRLLSEELAADPQVVDQRSLVALPTPWGLAKTQAPHWRFERTPARISRPSPQFGQDNDTVLDLLGPPVAAGPPATDLVRDDPAGLAPLAGVRVLETGTGVCAPLAGRVLRELGADVARIEPPDGDWLGTAAPEGITTGALYGELNDGKRIHSTDLTTPAGAAVLADELAGADVVLTGHRPRQLARLGLDDESLRQAVPDAVVCRVTGWGLTGVAADRPASELDLQATVGMYRHLGVAGQRPVRVGYDLVSVNTALVAVQGVLAALLERRRSGSGQTVEVSMLATAVAISQWGITAESHTDRAVGLQLEGYDMPPDLGVRSGDGRVCRLDFRKDHRNWYRLFDRLGVTELAHDERFHTEASIARHRNELAGLLTDRLGGWTFAQLDAYVRELGGTVVPALGLDELVANDQLRGLRIVQQGAAPSVRFPYLATHPRAAAPDPDRRP